MPRSGGVVKGSGSPKRNMLYNANFCTAQRGSSFSGTANSFIFTLDRWGFFPGAVSNYTISQQTHSSGMPVTAGRAAARVQRNSGNTSTSGYQFNQTLERRDSQPYSGKYVTLSFKAMRGANFSGASNIMQATILSTQTNGDTSYITGWVQTAGVASVNCTLTTSMQTFTVTGLVPANTQGLCVNFTYNPTGTAGANDWFQVEDVQLEEGIAPNAFDLKGLSPADDTALCQRYYYSINNSKHTGWIRDSDDIFGTDGSFFPTTMRITPSAAFSALGNYVLHVPNELSVNPTTLAVNVLNGDTYYFSGTATNALTGAVRVMEFSGGPTTFNAELP